jgi:uncharacterized protein with beta-barrel porin domain
LANAGGAVLAGDASITDGELILGSDLSASGALSLGANGVLAVKGAVSQNNTVSFPSISANSIVLDGTLAALVEAPTSLLSAGTPVSTTVARATESLTLNSADLSGKGLIYDYSFLKDGNDLNLVITPDNNVEESFAAFSQGSESLGSMGVSLSYAVTKEGAIPDSGTLEKLLLNLVKGSAGEAKEILSGLNPSSVAQSADIVKTVPVVMGNMLNSVLGSEPMGASYQIPPSSGSAPYSWTAVAAVTGHWGSGDGENLDPGYDLKSRLGLLSLYHSSETFRVGAALSAGTTETDYDNKASLESDDFAGALFIRYDSRDFYFSAAAFLGRSQIDSVRFPGLGLKAEADYKIKFSGLSLKAGRLWNFGSLRVAPSLGLNFVNVKFPGLEEKGAGDLSLRFGSDSSRSLEIELGALFSKDIDLGGKTFTPHLNIGVAYETQDAQMALSTSFVTNPGIPSFVSESPDAGRVRGIFELGGNLALTDYLNFFLDYKGSFRKNDRVHSLSLGLGLSW